MPVQESEKEPDNKNELMRLKGQNGIHRTVGRHNRRWQRHGPDLGKKVIEGGATVVFIDVNAEGMEAIARDSKPFIHIWSISLTPTR